MKIRIEFKPQDCWIGVFWRRCMAEWSDKPKGRTVAVVSRPQLDVWICVLPCLPLHITTFGAETREEVPYVPIPVPLDEVAKSCGWVVREIIDEVID